MEPILSISIQDYLKQIYELTEHGGSASTNALAERLHVRPASVTNMAQKLAAAKPALVEYHKHQGVKLTGEGKRAALEVIRHHRLLEAWLVQALDYSWDEVHDEAERLEHVISEDFERRIAAALGDPPRDPHGELIPTADLRMPKENAMPLPSMHVDQKGKMQCVKDADAALLRHLEGLGLIPGTQVEIVEQSPFDGNVTVKIGSKTKVLGPNIAKRIFVEPLK